MKVLKLIILIILCNKIIYCKDAHKCLPDTNVHIFKMSKPICNAIKLNNTVSVDIYKRNDMIYELDSFVVIINKYSCETRTTLFFPDVTKTIIPVQLTYQQYIDINSTELYVIGDGNVIQLSKYGDNTFGNNNSTFICKSSIFSDIINVNTNVLLIREKIYIRNGIISSSHVHGFLCKYHNKICVSGSKALIWNLNKEYEEKYILTNSNLTMYRIPDLVDNKINLINNDLHIAYSILNISNVLNDSSCQNCVITTDTNTVIKFNINKKLNEINNDKYNDIQNSLLDIVIDKECELLIREYEILMSMCREINPTACAMKILNNTNLYATMVDDYLIVNLCIPVKIIHYKSSMINNKCSVLIPVTYNLHNDIIDGYLDSKSLKIYDTTLFYKDNNKCISHKIISINSTLFYYEPLSGQIHNIDMIYNIEDFNKINKINNVNHTILLETRHVLNLKTNDKSMENGMNIFYIILTFLVLIFMKISYMYIVYNNNNGNNNDNNNDVNQNLLT